MLGLVATPTARCLEQSVRSCRDRFLVSSPYVGAFLPRLAAQVPRTVQKGLLTRADLRDFALGASDIDALCDLAHQGTIVQSVSGLHAKVYIVDEKWALVTSANATDSGMYRNWECGTTISDPALIAQLVTSLQRGFGSREPALTWTLEELEGLRGPAAILRKYLEPLTRVPRVEPERIRQLKLGRRDRLTFLAGFSGWLRLTLDAVLLQADEEFTLDAVFTTCSAAIAERFPNNRYPRAKVRQQLQRLRDLGLIEFLGGARYRRVVQS